VAKKLPGIWHMALLIIIAFVLVAAFQVPRLMREKRKKELVWFCIFSLIGFTLCMVLNAGVKMAGPIKLIMNVLDMIGVHY
jgi:hypothetical protein